MAARAHAAVEKVSAPSWEQLAADSTTPGFIGIAKPPSCEPPDRLGSVLHGTYRIVRRIAQGGMGAVYEAEHLRLRQKVAIKFLEPPLCLDGQALALFRQEAEISARLDHRDIVQVIDFNTDGDGTPYMVMELVEGSTLAEFLGGRALPVSEALRIAIALTYPLQSAHDAGVVHQDLKPSNVMVRRNGESFEVKLLDFGISKLRAVEEGLVRDHVVMGTPNYMSPEQARGCSNAVDARTDVFALGSLLYEMLAGRPAFDARSECAVLRSIVCEHPPSFRTLELQVPRRIERVVMRCLAKARDDRFASASEVRAALLGALRPFPRSCSDLWRGPSSRPRWIVRRLAAFGGSLCAGAVVVSGLVLSQPMDSSGGLEPPPSPRGATLLGQGPDASASDPLIATFALDSPPRLLLVSRSMLTVLQGTPWEVHAHLALPWQARRAYIEPEREVAGSYPPITIEFEHEGDTKVRTFVLARDERDHRWSLRPLTH